LVAVVLLLVLVLVLVLLVLVLLLLLLPLLLLLLASTHSPCAESHCLPFGARPGGRGVCAFCAVFAFVCAGDLGGAGADWAGSSTHRPCAESQRLPPGARPGGRGVCAFCALGGAFAGDLEGGMLGSPAARDREVDEGGLHQLRVEFYLLLVDVMLLE